MPRSPTAPRSKTRSSVDASGAGDQGELWFASQLPRGWVWQPPRRDVGKDGLIVIRDESDLNNVEFSVQVKATAAPQRTAGSIAIKNVARSSIWYWHASTHPTLLVAVNLATQSACYAWHFEVVDTTPKALASLPARLTLRIPSSSVLDASGWDAIRAELKRCYNYLWNSTSKSESFVFIVASINLLSTSAKHLFVLTQRGIPKQPLSEDDAIRLLLEEGAHRNVLAVAHKARRALPATAKLHQDIGRWLQKFQQVVIRCFPRIELEPLQVGNEIGTELAVVLEGLAESRSQALLLIFELMTLLSKIHPTGSHNAA